MSREIKNTAIPAAGYHYQTMQGLKLLSEWLDAPSRYTGVFFECDEDDVSPQGLDDLVAERADGKVDVCQVKFTPSPDKHHFDWAFLFYKTGKAGGESRPNLRKWFDALISIAPERLGTVRLLTNRVPDLVMERCLEGGNRINYMLAPEETRQKVEKILGSPEAAARFFAVLYVQHSDRSFDGLDQHVTDRLRRHGTNEGLLRLRALATNWAIRRNSPAPDGRITLDLLYRTLQGGTPEPLPEDFVIPAGYQVPNELFHEEFLTTIQTGSSPLHVLTGPPGRGKSTYLSKLCEVLQSKDIPCLRHHYFLSTSDRSGDRHTSHVVTASLISQIEQFHPDVRLEKRDLAESLYRCATHYKDKGKPFVVIIDGLDHVWRNQAGDKRPLDDLFDLLLPTPENMVLLVGTQPVEDAQLPVKLLAAAPRDTWRELPPMTAAAVLQHLREQAEIGRLTIREPGIFGTQEHIEGAEALRARTRGHPLHVLYATEELIRSGKPLSSWNVGRLLGDMSQDARTYYASLWHLLKEGQRDVLRLACQYSFFWPKNAFGELAQLAGAAVPDVGAVEHLMHTSAAGLRPFHESLVVFVKQTDQYADRIAALRATVEEWLRTRAPNSLRTNWLWLVQAQGGAPAELISGLQRDWVLARLQEGYPTNLFVRLLKVAEEHAIQEIDYPSAYRLRHLKTRLMNCLSYQIVNEDAARLQSFTWALAPDSSVINEAIASRHETSVAEVAALSAALAKRGDAKNALVLAKEALRRHRGETRFAVSTHLQSSESVTLFLARVFSEQDVLAKPPNELARWLETRDRSIAQTFLSTFVDKGSIRALMDLIPFLRRPLVKHAVCDAVFRATSLEEVSLVDSSQIGLLPSGTLVGCLRALTGQPHQAWPSIPQYDWTTQGYDLGRESLARLAHEWIFGAARLELEAGGSASPVPPPEVKKRNHITSLLEFVGQLGVEYAARWKSKQQVRFSDLYRAHRTFFHGGEIQDWNVRHDYTRTLHRIAIDIHLIGAQLGHSSRLDFKDIEEAMCEPWFNSGEFRAQYASQLPKVLSDEAAELFVKKQVELLDSEIESETGERLAAALDLCEIALRHDLMGLAESLCRRCWDLGLGYAQRKDPTLAETVEALEFLAPLSPDDTKRLLSMLAPQIHRVLSYTDGRGTRHVLAQADSLLAKLNSGALVEKYKEHAETGEWNAAEDALKAYLLEAQPTTAIALALARTGLHAESVEALRTRAGRGDSAAIALYAEASNFHGADTGLLAKSEGGSTRTESKEFEGNVADYPIDELPRLLDDLKDSFSIGDEFLRTWYRHWEAKGQGLELLKLYESELLDSLGAGKRVNALLDLAFETKLSLEGAKAAYPYLVQAQISRGGWFGFERYDKQEQVEARLQRVVTRYKKKCDQFFQDSAWSWMGPPKKERVVPAAIMVYFLGLQGRVADATRYAEAMVDCVRDDTRTLNLSPPAWADKLWPRKEART